MQQEQILESSPFQVPRTSRDEKSGYRTLEHGSVVLGFLVVFMDQTIGKQRNHRNPQKMREEASSHPPIPLRRKPKAGWWLTFNGLTMG